MLEGNTAVGVKLADGTLFLPETMRPLLDVDLEASVDPAKITVDNLSAEWAGATIALSGEAPLEGESEVRAEGTVHRRLASPT